MDSRRAWGEIFSGRSSFWEAGLAWTEALKELLLRPLGVLGRVVDLAFIASLHILQLVLVLALDFFNFCRFGGLSILEKHFALSLGSICLEFDVVQLSAQLGVLLFKLFANDIDLVVGRVNLCLQSHAGPLDLAGAGLSGLLKLALVARGGLLQFVVFSAKLSQIVLQALAFVDSAHSGSLIVLEALHLDLQTLTGLRFGLQSGIKDFLSRKHSLILLDAAGILLGYFAGSLTYVILQRHELGAPCLTQSLILLKLQGQSVKRLVHVLVLLQHVGKFASPAASGVIRSLSFGSPVVVVLTHVSEVRLECVDLVGHLALGLRRVGLGSLEKCHPHSSLATGLLEGLDSPIPLLKHLTETVLLFGRDPEQTLHFREPIFRGTPIFDFLLVPVFLLSQAFLQVCHALVKDASVDDLNLDASLGSLELAIEFSRSVFSSSALSDFLLHLGLLQVQSMVDI
ncbi:hypothetical protein TOPH_05464 [Tolypocladium ophioglossoides CBS 100239]|uniref:Uncharacterized protein n=1 Tax=Tolypocladium ophioglossoides (strain CBS 100239) TaxID=1163406 RepID=A0A0L0N6X4_TOLOC|nr:hypothetical protein TOPH_05464 [Tolypocladium ophioglossoides CBS 100239]